MRFSLACFFAAAVAANELRGERSVQSSASPFVGAYLLIDSIGLAKLQTLASNAATLPFTRLFISFVSPSLVYTPGSNTLQYTRLGLSTQGPDYGFNALKAAVTQLHAGGVEVFISMGGWNDNCFPFLYTYYSVGGYGTSTPNYWKIQQYSSNGQLSGCTDSNEFCYTCEPPAQNDTMNDFGMFPEPAFSPTWQQSIQYIQANAGGSNAPVWDITMVPNETWTDPKTGIAVIVPGSDFWYRSQRDPYQDLVYLAKDLGLDGIDVDYEEMWHADYYKYGSGPWTLPQTVYKYAAVLYDIILNIKSIEPSLKLSTPAGAAGAWSTNWWGGNLKGVWYYLNAWYPSISQFMSTGSNAGGINVMTYDLSDNEQFYECPTPTQCTLDQQVAFYMGTYQQAGIPANVGYEIGTPAYPDPTHDPSHQLPLTAAEFALILQNTQPASTGAILWEVFKPIEGDGELTVTQVCQQLCKLLFPTAARCSGSIPPTPSA